MAHTYVCRHCPIQHSPLLSECFTPLNKGPSLGAVSNVRRLPQTPTDPAILASFSSIAVTCLPSASWQLSQQLLLAGKWGSTRMDHQETWVSALHKPGGVAGCRGSRQRAWKAYQGAVMHNYQGSQGSRESGNVVRATSKGDHSFWKPFWRRDVAGTSISCFMYPPILCSWLMPSSQHLLW